MSALGDHLLQQQILSEDSLHEAEISQSIQGGRLGTNLVELGLLELGEHAANLSDVTGAPLPATDWLEQPEARATHIVPMPLIRRYKLLPLARTRRRLRSFSSEATWSRATAVTVFRSPRKCAESRFPSRRRACLRDRRR